MAASYDTYKDKALAGWDHINSVISDRGEDLKELAVEKGHDLGGYVQDSINDIDRDTAVRAGWCFAAGFAGAALATGLVLYVNKRQRDKEDTTYKVTIVVDDRDDED